MRGKGRISTSNSSSSSSQDTRQDTVALSTAGLPRWTCRQECEQALVANKKNKLWWVYRKDEWRKEERVVGVVVDCSSKRIAAVNGWKRERTNKHKLHGHIGNILWLLLPFRSTANIGGVFVAAVVVVLSCCERGSGGNPFPLQQKNLPSAPDFRGIPTAAAGRPATTIIINLSTLLSSITRNTEFYFKISPARIPPRNYDAVVVVVCCLSCMQYALSTTKESRWRPPPPPYLEQLGTGTSHLPTAIYPTLYSRSIYRYIYIVVLLILDPPLRWWRE